MMIDMRACPFCGKEDGLEIVWGKRAGTLTEPYEETITLLKKGDPEFDKVEVRCECGGILWKCRDELVESITNRLGMDTEITMDMIEEELIRQWNLPRR